MRHAAQLGNLEVPFVVNSVACGHQRPGLMRRSVLAVLPQLVRGHAVANAPAFVHLNSKWQLRSFADDANLKKTALYDFHVAHGGEYPWKLAGTQPTQ